MTLQDLKTRLQGSTKLKTPTSQVLSRTPSKFTLRWVCSALSSEIIDPIETLEDNRAQKLDDNEAFLDDLLS